MKMCYGHATYEKILYVTLLCEMTCYVDKIKLQTQTTINASILTCTVVIMSFSPNDVVLKKKN